MLSKKEALEVADDPLWTGDDGKGYREERPRPLIFDPEHYEEDKAAMAINPNPPGVVQRPFTEAEQIALSVYHLEGKALPALPEALAKLAATDRSGRKVRHSSKFSEWGSPQPMYDKLHAEFDFILDAAAIRSNTKCPLYFGPDHAIPEFRDALKIDWAGSIRNHLHTRLRPVWCNPPFSREEKIPIEPWIEKFWKESQKGLTIVSPIPASIQTRWWEEFVRKSYEVRIIPHRVAFDPPPGYEGKATGAGNNTAVVIWKPWTGYREPYEAVYRYWSYRD
jgi:phage N-6-adenine-methyltransferase